MQRGARAAVRLGVCLAWAAALMGCSQSKTADTTAVDGGAAGNGLGGMTGANGGSGSGGEGPDGSSSGGATATIALGAACLPSNESDPAFSGYSDTEVGIELNSTQCGAGDVCLVNHFRGRVSCPYGQNVPGTDASVGADHNERCRIPGGSDTELVEVSVNPQLLARRSQNAVYCSCRCGGPDVNAEYCQCGSGFVCQDLVANLGFNQITAGSYCVKAGTEVSGPFNIDPQSCSWVQQDCGDSISVAPVDDVTTAANDKVSVAFNDWLRVDPQGGLLCLPIELPVEATGDVSCSLIEVQPNPDAGCDCTTDQAREEIPSGNRPLIEAAMSDRGLCQGTSCQSACACRITRLDGPAKVDCENNQASTANGWCYVDAGQGIGNPALVSGCPASGQRTLRLVGKGKPGNGAFVLVSCTR